MGTNDRNRRLPIFRTDESKDSAAALDYARRLTGDPTPGQIAAGNYRKTHITVRGLDIAIENKAGSVRRGVDPGGKEWETHMVCDYGYVKRSQGVDGDHVDVFLGPDLDRAPDVFVVHQRKAGDWKSFDEDKAMLGFMSKEEAISAYLKHFDDPRFLGPVDAMPFEVFVEKVLATKDSPSMIKSASPRLVLFLKATTTKTIVVPSYTNKHGQVVSAHTKVVHYDPAKEDHHVLAGHGSHSQKKALGKLSKLPHWHAMPNEDKLAHVLSLATNLQNKASASAALSGWKAAAESGKNPTKSQWEVFYGLPKDKQGTMLDAVGAATGGVFSHLQAPSVPLSPEKEAAAQKDEDGALVAKPEVAQEIPASQAHAKSESATQLIVSSINSDTAAMALADNIASGDSWAISEIQAALLSPGSKRAVVKNDEGHVVAAVAWHIHDDPPKPRVSIDHLGSLISGGGKALVAEALAFAEKRKLPLVLYSTPPAVSFYEGLEFKQVAGKPAGFMEYVPTTKIAPSVSADAQWPSAAGLESKSKVESYATGSHYQKKAHAKLTADPAFAGLPHAKQLEKLESEYKAMQGAASASAAVSQFVKNMKAGKIPPPAQVKALQALATTDPEKVGKIAGEIQGAIGTGKFMELMTHANAALEGKKPKIVVVRKQEAAPAPAPAQAKTAKLGNGNYTLTGQHGWTHNATGNTAGKGGWKATALNVIAGIPIKADEIDNVMREIALEHIVDAGHGAVTPEHALNTLFPPGSNPDSSPKEGDTKEVGGVTYVLKNGRWHKVGAETVTPVAPAAPQKVAVEQFTYENTTEGHNKFWSVYVVGNKLVTTYGKIGTKGSSSSKEYPDAAGAQKGMAKLFLEKMKKGYIAAGKQMIHVDAVAAPAESAPVAPTAAPKNAPAAPTQATASSSAPVLPSSKKATNKGATVMDGWPQAGPQKGSNPGGKFKDKQGVEWYCKFPKDPDAAKSEFLASKFYSMLGVAVPTLRLVEKDGKLGIASKWQDGLHKGSDADLAKADGAHSAFAIDAWLGNWDVVGLSNDNLLLDKDGKAVRIDVGGSLEYRAQGAKKGEGFGSEVIELQSLLDAGKNGKSAAVFAGITPEAMSFSLSQLNKLKPSQIEELCQKAGPGSDAKKTELAKKLIARRADILSKFKIRDQWAGKKIDESKLPVNPTDLPAPIDFANLNGPGKGLSSVPHVNAMNTADSAAMIAFAAQGNLTALKNYQYDAVDKTTGASLGKKPITDHPAAKIKEQWAGLIELLQSIAYPPVESLSMPSLGMAGSTEEVSEMAGTFLPGQTPETVSAEHRMGFFMKLAQIDDIHDLIADTKWHYLTTASKFVKDAKAAFSSLGSAVRAYVGAVQATGWINHVWSQGKSTVSASGNGGKYDGGVQKLASKIYEEAVDIPEGVILHRGMTDTTAGKSMMKQFLEAKPGLVIQNTDSMCTSYKEGWGWSGDVQMRIRCGKGCKGTPSFASGNFSSEHEITTLPGQRFVVLAVEKKGAKSVFVDVLMLPPDEGYVAELGKMAALNKSFRPVVILRVA